MDQSVIKFLKTYSYNERSINRLLVSSFVKTNKIARVKNDLINGLIINQGESYEYNQLKTFISLFNTNIDIDTLLELFEFVISPQDKEVNGAVYTPQYIREYIVDRTISSLEEQGKDISVAKFADIACGCGGFFKTIAEQVKEKTGKSYFEIYKNLLFGIDIQEYSIDRTKILLILHALINGEDKEVYEFNLYRGNSLSFDWSKVPMVAANGGFDAILGNPPYVGSSKIDEESKELLKNWTVTRSGKADLYIPFFQIAIESLNVGGILGYITVNTFQKSLNARALRNYFSTNGFGLCIIDFGGEQLFRGRSTYTCICIATKAATKQVKYVKSMSSDIQNIKSSDFWIIDYHNLDDYNGWNFVGSNSISIIDKIENSGAPLGREFQIRNGFATLKNKVYVFRPVEEDESYYYQNYKNQIYRIEKEICRDVIKPNTLKKESEIEKSIEKLVFPYKISEVDTDIFGATKRSLTLLEEDYFSQKFPYAYGYLTAQKQELSERDKGKGNYEKWYAFGRNQALTLSGYKLFLPYITDGPCFVFSDNRDLLFYNGYAIISDNAQELKVLQKILMSKIFWYYIQHTSRPYSSRYYSVAKNYIKRFGICSLTFDEKMELIGMDDMVMIDKFLCKKYEIDYEYL